MLRAAALCAALAAGGAAAQSLPEPPKAAPGPAPALPVDPASLSDAELLDLLARLEAQRRAQPRRVGIFGIPSGFAAPHGLGFAALSLTNRRDRGRLGAWDASLAFGLGLGDATRGIGVTPVIDITSVTPYHFGTSGKIGVKLSRNVALGAGWQGAASVDLHNILTWGDSRVLDPGASLTLSALGTVGRSGMPILLSAGYGSDISDRGTSPGGYAGLGVGLGPRLGASLGWYGDEAIAGVNFWPPGDRNMQISVGVGDITNRISGRRLLASVSIAAPLKWLTNRP